MCVYVCKEVSQFAKEPAFRRLADGPYQCASPRPWIDSIVPPSSDPSLGTIFSSTGAAEANLATTNARTAAIVKLQKIVILEEILAME